MKTVLLDGHEFPADPPARPRAMDDVAALAAVVRLLCEARRLVGFHERGLYKTLCRSEAACRTRLAAAREGSGASLNLEESEEPLLDGL